MDTRARSLIKIIIIAVIISAGFVFQFLNTSETGTTVYSNDKLLSRMNGNLFYSGKMFTGKIIELYINGDAAKVTSYKDGVEDGIEIAFYNDGKIMEQRYYEKGQKAGIHFGWWNNGNVKFIFNFKDGIYEGNQREWNEKGLLYTDFNYVKGHEEGLQRAWYLDGTLQANYVVKNNRKYGLTGVKNCQTAKDETNK